ncbi:MAG TPA: transglycosylase SLT domain-containing protein [Pseudomonadales bacterium]
MHQVWKQLPFLFKLQGATLVLAICATVVVTNVFGPQGSVRIAFAIPAVEHPGIPWQERVEAFGAKVSGAFGVRRSTANEFASWILEASLRHDLDPELLASLVHIESTFRKEALSPVGAVGPAQVRPNYWSSFCGSSNLQDPAENIYCGAQVLSHLRDRCGDEVCALRAYNIGMYGQEVQAASRYVAKIDLARDRLRSQAL